MDTISTQKVFLCTKASLKKLNRIFAVLLFFSVLSTVANAQVKINDGTATTPSTTKIPDPNAILELESGSKGVLLPRVALNSTNDPFPSTTHIAGMMVYNTATSQDVVPGYYVNNGSLWQKSIYPDDPMLSQTSVTFYDDTTGVTKAGLTTPTPYGTVSAPDGSCNNCYGQASYPASYGIAAGSTIKPVTQTNVLSVKKVSNGIYKIIFQPGTFKDNNYYPALMSSNGAYGASDMNWVSCNVPYIAVWGSTLFTCAASEEGQKALFFPNQTNQGGTTVKGRISIITKTKDFCYVTTNLTNGGMWDAAAVYLIFFVPAI
jgi:hypothetical protein